MLRCMLASSSTTAMILARVDMVAFWTIAVAETEASNRKKGDCKRYDTPNRAPIVPRNSIAPRMARSAPSPSRSPAMADGCRTFAAPAAPLSGRRTARFGRRQNAEPLRDRDRLRQRLNLQLLHDGVAVGLDGAQRGAQLERDLLVELAADDQLENLCLARRQRCDEGAQLA